MVHGYTTQIIRRLQDGSSFEDIESCDGFEEVYVVYKPDGSLLCETNDYQKVSQYFSDELIDEDYECVPNKFTPKCYNTGGDELRVKTKTGDLSVCVGHDADYPEFYIVLTTPQGVDLTLANIGQEGDSIKIRVKDYLPSDDFTNIIEFTKPYIEEAVAEILEED